MSRYSSVVFGYVVSKKKPRDPYSDRNPLYEKNGLIIMFVFTVLLGSILIDGAN